MSINPFGSLQQLPQGYEHDCIMSMMLSWPVMVFKHRVETDSLRIGEIVLISVLKNALTYNFRVS